MVSNCAGHKKGRSLLMDDGVLTWLLANSNIVSISTRRHIELALCHLAQNEDNTRDFVTSGGVKQLAKISVESSRDDIRDLAKKILRLNRSFKAEVSENEVSSLLDLVMVRCAHRTCEISSIQSLLPLSNRAFTPSPKLLIALSTKSLACGCLTEAKR
nr:armadillo repeat-containing kinesin-like protein 1 [Tanacetum cinerariifolium]